MSKKRVMIFVLFIITVVTIVGLGGAVAAGTFHNDTSVAEYYSIDENSSPKIPQLTESGKAKAEEVALHDTRIQELTKGKIYTVAPDGHIGVWHSTSDKDLKPLGAVLEIKFDKVYQIEYDWPILEYDEDKFSLPYYQETTVHAELQVNGLYILVDLTEHKVVEILPNENREIS